MSLADVRQQLPFPIEDLKPVFHCVGYPDVPIAIDSDALGPGKVSWTIAVLAENADEISVGVKDLDPIVESIGHIHIAILIQRHTLWCTKIAW